MHEQVSYVVAHGIASKVDGKKVVIGSRHFVFEDEGCVIPEGEEEKLSGLNGEFSYLYLAVDGILAAVICIADPVRAEAKEVIAGLHELGIQKVCMLTGDNQKTAEAVADKIGLDEYLAEVLPEDKAAYIKKEQAADRKVIMIGDGVNDTLALSEADVGIAVSDGAMIAREISDVTVSDVDLHQLIVLRKVSMRLKERIDSNYRFIISFNALLILLGVLGILPPSSSALLHNSSTIITGLKSMTSLLEEKDERKRS
jgi:P-type E1-E2 ATPase